MNLSLFQIWFSVRVCLWSDFGFRSDFVFVPNLVFGPEIRLVRICLLCTFVFVPNFSVVFIWFSVRICLCSGFVASPNLIFTPDLCLVRIWFSVRICLWYEIAAVPNLVFGPEFLWSEFVFCALLFLVRTCRWPLSGFRYDLVFDLNLSFPDYVVGPNLVFTPDMCLVRICFSVRICLWYEIAAVPNLVFWPEFPSVRIFLLCTFVCGPNLSVTFIWFSVRPGLWSEFVFPRFCR